MPAGPKRESVAFEKRGVGDSTYGLRPGDWVEQFRTTARIVYFSGGEDTIGQRLMGVQPVEITTHAFTQTNQVTTAWRIRDLRTDRVFSISTCTPGERPGADRVFLCRIGGPKDADD